MRIQKTAALVLVANAIVLGLFAWAIDLPLWWWGIVAGVLGLLFLTAQWRRCVPSFSHFSRSRSPRPPTQP